MVWFDYCLNCIVNMLILAKNIYLSWNPCNNYIAIKASVFYTTKPINPVICLMMNLYIASFTYYKALSWLMELKFSSQKSITCAIFNSNKAYVYFLGFIHPNQHNSYQLSYRNITHQQFPQSGILYIHSCLILEAVAFSVLRKLVYFLIGHYTYRMFLPAIDIIPTSLAVAYSNRTYIN